MLVFCFRGCRLTLQGSMLEQPPEQAANVMEFGPFFPLQAITFLLFIQKLLTKSKFQNLKHEYSWKPKLKQISKQERQ